MAAPLATSVRNRDCSLTTAAVFQTSSSLDAEPSVTVYRDGQGIPCAAPLLESRNICARSSRRARARRRHRRPVAEQHASPRRGLRARGAALAGATTWPADPRHPVGADLGSHRVPGRGVLDVAPGHVVRRDPEPGVRLPVSTGPVLRPVQQLHVPMWAGQRVWSALLLVLAIEGARRVGLRLGFAAVPALATGVAATAWRPRVVTTDGVISAETLVTTVLPWVVLPLMLLLDGRVTLGAPWCCPRWPCSSPVGSTPRRTSPSCRCRS